MNWKRMIFAALGVLVISWMSSFAEEPVSTWVIGKWRGTSTSLRPDNIEYAADVTMEVKDSRATIELRGRKITADTEFTNDDGISMLLGKEKRIFYREGNFLVSRFDSYFEGNPRRTTIKLTKVNE